MRLIRWIAVAFVASVTLLSIFSFCVLGWRLTWFGAIISYAPIVFLVVAITVQKRPSIVRNCVAIAFCTLILLAVPFAKSAWSPLASSPLLFIGWGVAPALLFLEVIDRWRLATANRTAAAFLAFFVLVFGVWCYGRSSILIRFDYQRRLEKILWFVDPKHLAVANSIPSVVVAAGLLTARRNATLPLFILLAVVFAASHFFVASGINPPPPSIWDDDPDLPNFGVVSRRFSYVFVGTYAFLSLWMMVWILDWLTPAPQKQETRANSIEFAPDVPAAE